MQGRGLWPLSCEAIFGTSGAEGFPAACEVYVLCEDQSVRNTRPSLYSSSSYALICCTISQTSRQILGMKHAPRTLSQYNTSLILYIAS
jgi:hypothetical protein